MAICPECHTRDKPFFAPRCHACNSEIGFWYQLAGSWVATGTTIFGFWFLAGSLFTLSFLWQPLVLWLLIVVGPFVVVWMVWTAGIWAIISLLGLLFLLTTVI